MFVAKLPPNVTSRTDVLSEIRTRAMRATGRYLNDSAALRLSLCCATREPTLCASYMFSNGIVDACMSYVKFLAITADEFSNLFGQASGLAEANPDDEAQCLDVVQQLQKAMSSTLAEKDWKTAWASTTRRLVVSLALHLTEFEQLLPRVLCPPLRSDLRRVEDLRDTFEQKSFDAVLFNNIVASLLKCARVA